MADGDVIADEQVPAQEIPASEALEEAAAADLTLDGSADGVADDTAPLADEAPPTLDSILERDERLREQYEERVRERENAGANRERARLQREAGKKEVTTRNVQRYLAENGIEVDDPARLHYFFDLATAHEAMELATNVPDALMRNYTVPVEAREKALAAREAGDWDGYLSHLLDGAAETQAAKKAEARLAQIEAENKKWRAAELAAMRAEMAPAREAALATPSGQSPGRVNPSLLEGAAYEEWKRTTSPDEQLAAWRAHSRGAA